MKILLAVSGGVDSMYLAHNAGDFFPGYSFAVAHCNFSLRGDESDGDEKFVRDWCTEHHIPLYVKRFDTPEFAASNGISIEMAARDLRYGWFAELCREKGYEGVAVAHNANDNAETLILNLLRGSGSRGMRGMSPESHIPGTEFLLLRPMLGISRQTIEDWMRTREFGWREDSTNSQTLYKRNRIRHEVFPAFAAINPSFLEALGRGMRNVAETDDIADDYFKQAKAAISNDGRIMSIPELMQLKHWKYVLYRFVENNVNSTAEYDNLVALLESGRQVGGRRFGNIVTSTDKIILCEDRPDTPEIKVEMMERPEDLQLKQPVGTILMDAAKIPFPPTIRPWREGDWMIPLGMRGRKKISDLMTDLKLSLPEKEMARVVEFADAGSRVAALVGYRIDDSVKITDTTERIIVLKSV